MNAAHSSARLVGWSQWVDATLSSNPTALKTTAIFTRHGWTSRNTTLPGF